MLAVTMPGMGRRAGQDGCCSRLFTAMRCCLWPTRSFGALGGPSPVCDRDCMISIRQSWYDCRAGAVIMTSSSGRGCSWHATSGCDGRAARREYGAVYCGTALRIARGAERYDGWRPGVSRSRCGPSAPEGGVAALPPPPPPLAARRVPAGARSPREPHRRGASAHAGQGLQGLQSGGHRPCRRRASAGCRQSGPRPALAPVP